MTHDAIAPAGSGWRRRQFLSLVDFGRASLRAEGGASWLDDEGRPVTDRPVESWITCRMAHVFALAHLLGVPEADQAADRALEGLLGYLADREHGGWVASRGPGGADVVATKQAYAHAFVVLAGATATVAGRPGAPALLDDALRTLDERFWEAEHRLHLDERSADWTVVDPYRGVNANMHAVEALLAAFDATGEREWLSRAASIADRVVGWAEANGWRIPEHYDASWNVQRELNADRPNDPFKPYGATPGHGLEWARLLLQLDVAGDTAGERTAAATALFDRAATDGWDGDGFVYTTDWEGRPVERRRFHWVAAEAVAAADVLHRVTGQERFADAAASWWRWIDLNLVDHERGSWHHELDTENRPSGRTWVGKPDVYHAAQAVILPDLPLAGSFGEAARLAGPILAPTGSATP
ncbi:AGE family epimerase/isomerase [Isoptericola variabilis]|uniref:N-acylglucosamine 2-epimerase n=1 Tax=Isoptericola variabilis (strain 225) TaxID=743718 RepID=F6FVL8_ISOV2|nr:AGE family epimerase/isomerase [Isoptericola variabilis]AEG45519.1 N-acylglucosamine 2-epimerase [Isoptericola variabilis 225]TWH33790.1 mannose/cellobiose epimerase-like protein (N-acyl-D-glucosamine 2-epimerase family) [Isoptericola variabilis J7]